VAPVISFDHDKKISEIQESLSRALNAMPGVFSTVQWAGRAYKLPGPGSRGTKKPLLLTHVCLNKAEDAVCLGFRLEKSRARAIVRKHTWIKPHSFRTLSKTGWLETQVRTKAQSKVIIELLRESRTLHPMPEKDAGKQTTKPARHRKRAPHDETDPITRRFDAVLRQKREDGWRPVQSDAFDD
jgi:hypothetical protein